MGYNIEKADLTRDQVKVVRFWKTNFPAWPEEKYSWFYQNNVAGAADCWLITNEENGTVIGTTVIFPRKFIINNRDYLGGITGDFAVDKQYRVLGPALKLQREVINSCESGKYHFLYGFPNMHSEPVQKRVGFVVVGSAIRLVKVVRTYRYLRRVLKVVILSKFFSFFLDFIIRMFQKETWYRLSDEYEAKFLQKFDERFEKLWEVASVNFPIIGERSQQFLTWRFQNCPYQDYQIFVLEKRSDASLLGYVVFSVKEKDVLIVDCFARDKNEAYSTLLAAFLKEVRKFRIDSISIVYLGNEFLVNILKGFNFSQRADKRNIVAYTKKGLDISEIIKDSANWYFLAVDND